MLNRKNLPILIILLTALSLRFFLLPLPAFSIDMNDWIAWAQHLLAVGPQQFYTTIWSDYLPSYLYVLWLLAWLHQILQFIPHEFLIKIPPILADLGIGFLLFKIVKEKKGENLGLLTASFFLFNPFSFFNSSIWGQNDAVFAFLLLFASYLMTKNKEIFSGIFLGVAFLIKPQAVFFLPLFLIYLLKKGRGGNFLKQVLIFILTVFLISWPFFPNNPIFGLYNLMIKSANTYPYTSVFAMNFWGIFGTWKPDNQIIFCLTKQVWGLLFLAISLFFCWFIFLKNNKKEIFYFSASFLAFSWFMLPTRVHERWLLPFFPLFLASAGLLNNKKLWFVFLSLSLLHFLNLYYPYTYYNENFLKIQSLADFIGENFSFLSLLSFLIFIFLFFFAVFSLNKLLKIVEEKEKPSQEKTKASHLDFLAFFLKQTTPDKILKKENLRYEKILVFSLIIVAFLIRVIRLDIPPTYMFDEVYHAFTAVEMDRGNKAAWEWWNTPPSGFAYEWSHPPFAKEAMLLGIKLLGSFLPKQQEPRIDGQIDPNPFSWRFPVALFGTGVVLMVYLLGKELFGGKVGLISAFLVCFDGLTFVQSRIGMNDSFFLFFMLLAFYLFLKKKLFGTGISLGFSLASKWTAMYAVGILGGLFLLQKFISFFVDQGKEKIKQVIKGISQFLLIFIFLPIIVYLFSYLPFFTSGHTWEQFNELQHQMWWYHTRLKATHPYTSPWYSWPFMYRPVWYYVNYNPNKIVGEESSYIQNIYAMGNPIIWWAGLGAIGYLVFVLFKTGWDLILNYRRVFLKKENKASFPLINSKLLFSLIFVLFGYFGFFVPWAFSPRIMFIYHYLPSVPFMCLALGFFLNKFVNFKFQISKFKIPAYLGYLFLVLLVFFYFYPHLSALTVPRWWADHYFWLKSWR